MYSILFGIAILVLSGLGFYSYYHVLMMLPKRQYNKRIAIGIIIALFISMIILRLVLGFYLNALIIFVIFDIVSLLLRHFTRIYKYYEKVYQNGFTVLVVALLFSIYGVYNVSDIKITEYMVSIDKNIEDMNVVMASDIHLSTAIGKKELDDFLETTKAEKPDMVFLVGDIYDEGSTDNDMQYSYEIFSQLTQICPVYYVTGNHEVGHGQGGIVEERHIIESLEDVGIVILNDQVIELPNVYIIGRQDASLSERKDITELVKELSKDKMKIVLDHQPIDYQAEKEAGVDVVLSGHTHGGQLLPVGQLDSLFKVNDLNYGYLRDDNLQAIVSSGMGVWGFPMRTSKHSEIVVLHFNEK